MPKTEVVERSVIQLRGEKKRVKLIARRESGGTVYDVTIGNSVEYKDIKRESDAQQLYRQAKKDATADLKSDGQGTGEESGGSGVVSTFKSGLSQLGADAGRAMDAASQSGGESQDRDADTGDDTGPSLAFMGGTGEGDTDGGTEPTLAFMGGESGGGDGDGPMLPGFGQPQDQDGGAGAQLPGFGNMDGQDGGTGPTLPGFGFDQQDSDDEDSDPYNFPGF